MERSIGYIVSIFASIALCSLVYFLGLILGLPYLIIFLLCGLLCFLAIRYLNSLAFAGQGLFKPTSALILVVGIILITNRSYYLATVWGDWDAWCMWNLHTRYLCDPVYWKGMFHNIAYDHPDYPPGLPAILAFLNRGINSLGFGDQFLLITFGLHFLITLCTPLLIFLEIQGKNLVIASLTILYFATNDFYLERGLSQYADTLLGLFLLLCLIMIQQAKHNSKFLTPAFFFSLCMAWTKNEGLLLCGVFVLFYRAYLLRTRNQKLIALGTFLPLMAILIFKFFYAPGNDLVTNGQQLFWDKLIDGQRYLRAWDYFKHSGLDNFLVPIILVLIYLLVCMIRRTMPHKQFFLVFSCLLLYYMVYVVTPYEQGWHLITSQVRLIHQLIPALVYVIGMHLASFPLPVSIQKFRKY